MFEQSLFVALRNATQQYHEQTPSCWCWNPPSYDSNALAKTSELLAIAADPVEKSELAPTLVSQIGRFNKKISLLWAYTLLSLNIPLLQELVTQEIFNNRNDFHDFVTFSSKEDPQATLKIALETTLLILYKNGQPKIPLEEIHLTFIVSKIERSLKQYSKSNTSNPVVASLISYSQTDNSTIKRLQRASTKRESTKIESSSSVSAEEQWAHLRKSSISVEMEEQKKPELRLAVQETKKLIV